MKLTTTLSRIRACSPCANGWKKLNTALGVEFDIEQEINLLTILESNGVADMLWCLRATRQDSRKIASQLAIEFAGLSLCYFEAKYPNDKRPHDAIQAARDFNYGKITIVELREKRAAAADAAAYAADAAAYAAAAAAAAAYAADAAAYAADAYAAAAYAAAAAAAYAAAAAAYAAAAAAAADAAARQKMRDKQSDIIRMILCD
jgi:hypothetical protein